MRVLLLDEGFMSGVFTARGLRRAGCAVDVIAATGGSGRRVGGGDSWRLAPRVDDPRLMDVLDAVIRRARYDIIYPITEPLQRLVWDEAPAWQTAVYPLVEQRHRAARRDKRRMSELVAGHGVAIPQQLSATGDTGMRHAVHELGLPIVIKGISGRGGNATRICTSLDAALAAARQLTADGRSPFAQAYVDGVTFLAGGLFDRGRTLRFYSGAKTVQFPSRVGPAAEITSVNDPELAAVASRVFAAAEVTGLASIDLVRDRTGRYHFLELNPRPWGSIEAAVGAGVDLFDALARLWRSERVSPRLEFREGVLSPIFPLYVLATQSWQSGRAAHALLPDCRRAFSLARDDPMLAGHVLHRLMRVGLNW
ncbi:MAG: ATP-grasp domain-containing protein [Gemmatimonadaceae bacterium]